MTSKQNPISECECDRCFRRPVCGIAVFHENRILRGCSSFYEKPEDTRSRVREARPTTPTE